MKLIGYALYGMWIVSSIVLKILGLVSWFVAFSWLWFPLALVLTIFVGINVAAFIGTKLKMREDSKIPDSCEACLFGQTAKYAENGKCLGCTMDENHKYGELCSAYKRNITH